MQDIDAIIRTVAATALSGRTRDISYRVYDGSVIRNKWGVEVQPEPSKGPIVARQDGYYVQKAGPSLLVAYLESLIPVELNIGDKVEIKAAGFDGSKDGGEQTQDIGGVAMRFTTLNLVPRQLSAPQPVLELEQMTSQLSALMLPDGRRGLHMLSDLNYQNFRGDASEAMTFNPYLEFEVSGAKFTGTVRMELILGADTYELHFTDANGTVKKEDVAAEDTLALIEEHCDSGPARFAKVTIISRAKKPKAPKEAPAEVA